VAAVAAIILVCGYVQNNVPSSDNGIGHIGGQRDSHECLGPAGYSWNASIGACVREWELDQNQRNAAKIAVAPLSFPVTVLSVAGLDRCPDCYLVTLQRNNNQEQITTRIEGGKIAPANSENSSMTIAEARRIAENSDCVKEGDLTGNYSYNPNSRTWWIDLDAKKNGCSPACVVGEETKTAEINWRCTGLKTPDTQPGTQDKPIGGYRDEHGCLIAAGYSWDAGIGACIRTWELKDDARKAAKIAVASQNFKTTVVGVTAANCTSGCFSVRLQNNDHQGFIIVELKNWKVAGSTVEGAPEASMTGAG
jgi:hypothetical protein